MTYISNFERPKSQSNISRGDFWSTIKARLLVTNKYHFQQKNVYPRDPPPGNGRPQYVFQLSDIGFMGKISSLMVTSSHIWLISPILNVPNLKVIFFVENSYTWHVGRYTTGRSTMMFSPNVLGIAYSWPRKEPKTWSLIYVHEWQ